MQLTRNALAFLQAGLHATAQLGGDLPDAQPVQQPQRSDRAAHRQRSKPPGLPVGGRHGEGQRCAGVVPHAVVVARDDPEDVVSRADARVAGLAATAGIAPFGVVALELVAEPNALWHRQAGRRVIDAQIGLADGQGSAFARVDRPAVGRQRADDDGGRQRIPAQMPWVDDEQAAGQGGPQAAITGFDERGQGPNLARAAEQAITRIEALHPHREARIGQRALPIGGFDQAQAVGGIDPELARSGLDDACDDGRVAQAAQRRRSHAGAVEQRQPALAAQPDAWTSSVDGRDGTDVQAVRRAERQLGVAVHASCAAVDIADPQPALGIIAHRHDAVEWTLGLAQPAIADASVGALHDQMHPQRARSVLGDRVNGREDCSPPVISDVGPRDLDRIAAAVDLPQTIA